MKDRFKGWPMMKVAAAASLECQVGYNTCYDVLFKGKPVSSPATQRVLWWAQREGFPIRPPKNGSRGVKGNSDGADNPGPSVDAMLDAAERKVGLSK